METPNPNAATRKKLAINWQSLNDEEKLIKRAARSRQGVKCDICGKIGYYREICPNECKSPPGTPNSMDSTPPATPPKEPSGLGMFWGSQFSTTNGESPRGRYDYKKKVDVNTVRPKAKVEEKRLKDSDADVGTFEFFSEAQEGYSRTYPELTLHQVMRRLMRLLERQLNLNASKLEAAFDTTLLHPPVEQDRDTFYPPELSDVKAYREYFLAKELKKDRKLNYKNQSSLRTSDELDPLFRGGVVDDTFLYSTNPHAGASMHSKNTWKSVLSHSDGLASSDPKMAIKQQKINKLFEEQSKWIAMQQRSMAHRNDRFEHLVNILRTEINAEHSREVKALTCTKHASKAVQLSVWQERLESVDAIMNCLNSYNFTSGLDEADFLVFCFEKWRETISKKVNGDTATLTTSGDTAGTLPAISKKNKTASLKPPLGNPAVTKHNKMIASSSPYFADQQAVETAERKTRKLRDKFLEDGVIARAKRQEESDKLEKMTAARTQRRLSQGPISHASTPRSMCSNSTVDNDNDNQTAAGDSLSCLVNSNSTTMRHSDNTRRNSVHSTVSQTHSMSEQTYGSSSDLSSLQYQLQTAVLPVQNTVQSDLAQSIAEATHFSETLLADREAKRAKRKLMQTSRAKKVFTVVHRKHPREVDAEAILKAKVTFQAADISSHIRRGVDNDLACVAPALIPVPGAFDGDGRHPMSSYVAENIVHKIKKNMVLSDLGYTPQSMLPLYVRNTLIEKLGTTPGGDQSYDSMAGDRRYSHYIGRPLNRFEPDATQGNDGSQSVTSSGYGQQKLSYTMKPLSVTNSDKIDKKSGGKSGNDSGNGGGGGVSNKTTDRHSNPHAVNSPSHVLSAKLVLTKRLQREERRQLATEKINVRSTPMTGSLVRMVFKNPDPTLTDLHYIDEF